MFFANSHSRVIHVNGQTWYSFPLRMAPSTQILNRAIAWVLWVLLTAPRRFLQGKDDECSQSNSSTRKPLSAITTLHWTLVTATKTLLLEITRLLLKTSPNEVPAVTEKRKLIYTALRRSGKMTSLQHHSIDPFFIPLPPWQVKTMFSGFSSNNYSHFAFILPSIVVIYSEKQYPDLSNSIPVENVLILTTLPWFSIVFEPAIFLSLSVTPCVFPPRAYGFLCICHIPKPNYFLQIKLKTKCLVRHRTRDLDLSIFRFCWHSIYSLCLSGFNLCTASTVPPTVHGKLWKSLYWLGSFEHNYCPFETCSTS